MITDQYKKHLSSLHQQHRFVESNFWYDDIRSYINQSTNRPASILDFGCAHGGLIQKLKNDFPDVTCIDGYDPGVKQYENKPTKYYDLLISTDVIEHIEPQYLDQTLAYIDSLFAKDAWIIIACYPAKKFLPDGRNAHLIIENPDWWIAKIRDVMILSKIESWEIKILNPDKPIRNKKTKEILVPIGKQIELRLVLKK